MNGKPNVLLIATLDTKEQEARYIRDCLEKAGVDVFHLDTSIRRTIEGGAEIGPDEVAGGGHGDMGVTVISVACTEVLSPMSDFSLATSALTVAPPASRLGQRPL